MSEPTPTPFDWATAPDMLRAEQLRHALGQPGKPVGKNQVYAWMKQHPGLVMRCGGKTRSVPKARLQRFLAGDPEIVALAVLDPYAKPASTWPGSHLKVA